jgi:FlaA1/EpsC-like NDP-sugar epimerase
MSTRKLPTLNTRDKALLLDSVAWLAGVNLAVWSRYEGVLTPAAAAGATALGFLAICCHAVLGHVRFIYRGRHRFGTFDEVITLGTTVAASAVVVFTIDLLSRPRLAPISVPLVGGVLAMVFMLGGRYAYRLRAERRLRRRRATPALLFGAGSAGHDLVRAMLNDQRSPYRPVGLLDDDPDKRHLRVQGVPVLGGRRALNRAVAATGARALIFAVANADAELIRDVRRLTLQAGLTFKVVPSVGELLDQRASLTDVRDVAVTDLLGRRQIETDLSAIAECLRGRRVLVTGAGGSIGAELCRQIRRFEPASLIMLDRDESALHAVQLSLSGRALLDSPETVLADLRDRDAIARVFATHRPQVVVHAAALKHLPLLERYPAEAVKTNIWGTQNLLDQCGDVDLFVNISTDKAANPGSVLGYSKRITERLTAHANTVHNGRFLNVRFGNVLGSRGSVLTAFMAQAAAGGPITVTHPEVTRFLMTIQEAVQLVIQAAAIGSGGDVLVLDMGTPVRIADLARQVAELTDRPVPIVYTGLRPGEKMHEELLGDGEAEVRSVHPLISQVMVPPLDPLQALALDPAADPADLIGDLAALCAVDPQPLTLTVASPLPVPGERSAMD